MSCFERRVLRWIYGPVLESEGYRKRKNREVKLIYLKLGINAYLISKELE